MSDANPRPDQITPPWDSRQVAALNAFQDRGDFHPFTCANGCGNLVATATGWLCRRCGYRQDWAWAFMADPSAPSRGIGTHVVDLGRVEELEEERNPKGASPLRERDQLRRDLDTVMEGSAIVAAAARAAETEALALRGRVEELEANRPKCHICGAPAACLGQYDTMEAPSWACGECCGHGNEDGWCWAFEAIPEKVGALARECFEQRELAEGHIDFIADFHPQAVATGAENERLRARLEEAVGLLHLFDHNLPGDNLDGAVLRRLRSFLEENPS